MNRSIAGKLRSAKAATLKAAKKFEVDEITMDEFLKFVEAEEDLIVEGLLGKDAVSENCYKIKRKN